MAFIRNVDKLIEGLENKFFTEARAKAALAPELAAEESARLAGDSAEAAARQSADNALDARLDVIEGSGEGSIAKAEQDAKDYADQKVAALVNSAPAVLDTLKELSDALGGDQNFATTVANQIGAVDDKVDQEILDRQSAVSAEQSARESADQALDGRLDILEQDPTTKSYVDGEVLDLQGQITQEISDRQAAVEAEESARELADNNLSGRISTLEADPTTKTYVDGQVSSLDGRLDIIEGADSVEGSVAKAEKDAKDYADSLNSAMDMRVDVLEQDPTTKSYVDGEVLDLQGQIDAEESRAMGAESALDSRLDIIEGLDSVEGSVAKAEKDAKDYADSLNSAMDMRVDVLEQDPTTKSYVDQEVSAEESRAMSAESALDARLDIIEGIDSVEGSVAKAEKDAKDYADSLNSAMDARVDVLEQDPTTKSYVDGVKSNLQGQINQEKDDRQAGDNALDGRLDILESDPTTKSYVDGIQSALDSRLDVLESDPVTKSYVDGEVSDLQGQVNTEKGRIDAILSAADADKDSFAEIVSLINSVDTSNDNAFASYVLSNDAALAQEISDREADVDAEETRALAAESLLDGRLDVLESDPTTKSYVDSEVSAEESRAMSAESALDARLDIIEGLDSVEGSVAKAEKDAKDYADGLNSAEQSARQSADTTLQTNINNLFDTKSTSDLVEGSRLYYTQARFDSAFAAKSTTNLSEGVNLYYTQARFDSAFSAKSTSNLSEGSNLYYTTARVNADAAKRDLSNTTLNLSFLVDDLPLAGGSNSENTNFKGNAFFSNKPLTVSSNAATGQNTFFGSLFSPATLSASSVGNSAFGNNALRALTSGVLNTSVGLGAGRAITTGSTNTIVGALSGMSITTATDNTVIGGKTFQSGTSTGNVYIGYLACASGAGGGWSVGVGYEALKVNNGLGNVGIGSGALKAITTSTGSVAIGANAGILATGANNTFVGYDSGKLVTTGASNIIIGYNIQASSATASNEINIGDVYKANSSQITLNKDVEMVSGQKVKYSQKAAAYTLVASDYIIAVSDMSVSRVMTLPSAVTMGAGKTFIIKDQSGAASQSNYIQIAPQVNEKIDGQNDYKIVMPYESVMLVSNGSHWFII